jgi:hypothetical protein
VLVVVLPTWLPLIKSFQELPDLVAATYCQEFIEIVPAEITGAAPVSITRLEPFKYITGLVTADKFLVLIII